MDARLSLIALGALSFISVTFWDNYGHHLQSLLIK